MQIDREYEIETIAIRIGSGVMDAIDADKYASDLYKAVQAEIGAKHSLIELAAHRRSALDARAAGDAAPFKAFKAHLEVIAAEVFDRTHA